MDDDGFNFSMVEFKKLFFPFTTTKAIFFLILLGIITFSNSIFNDFVYDDIPLIVYNPIIHSLTNIPTFFSGGTYLSVASINPTGFHYEPIITTIFSIIYTFFGNTAFFFHLFQLTIFISNVIIVYFIFKKFISDKFAFLFSSLFLVHPINEELAVYISNTQDTLYFFFGTLGLLITIYKKYSPLSMLTTAILLFLSLLSKETGLAFLLIIPTYHILFKTGKGLPYNILSSILLFLYAVLRFGIANLTTSVDSNSPLATIPFFQRLLNIPAIISYYLKIFIFPKNLVTSEYWIVKQSSWADFYLPLIVICLFILLLITFGKLLSSTKSYNYKTYLLFCFIFLLGLSFHLQLVPLDGTVANRWFYLSGFGLFGILATTFEYIYTKYKLTKNPKLNYGLFCLFLIIFLILLVQTLIRNTNWQNTLTLMAHDTQITKDNFSLENEYGYVLINYGQLDKAKEHLEKSIALAPKDTQNWNNLGVLYSISGNIQLAEDSFNKSIANGDFFLAYDNLSTLYLLNGNLGMAKEIAQKGLKKYTLFSHLWLVLAVAEDQLGNHDGVLFAAQKAYSITPTNATFVAYNNALNNIRIDMSLLRKD